MTISIQNQIQWAEKKIIAKEKERRDAKEKGQVFAVKAIDDEIKVLKAIIIALSIVCETENKKAAVSA